MMFWGAVEYPGVKMVSHNRAGVRQSTQGYTRCPHDGVGMRWLTGSEVRYPGIQRVSHDGLEVRQGTQE
jgi:hypothetical protein